MNKRSLPYGQTAGVAHHTWQRWWGRQIGDRQQTLGILMAWTGRRRYKGKRLWRRWSQQRKRRSREEREETVMLRVAEKAERIMDGGLSR